MNIYNIKGVELWKNVKDVHTIKKENVAQKRGDVALTIMQSIPLTGIIMVTSPQQLVSMIVEKGIKMTEKMKVPILGIIENMSYIQPPGYPEPYYLFGEGNTEEIAKSQNIEFLGKLPIVKEFVEAADAGVLELFHNEDFEELGRRVSDRHSGRNKA